MLLANHILAAHGIIIHLWKVIIHQIIKILFIDVYNRLL